MSGLECNVSICCSTLWQLLITNDDFAKAINNRQQIDVSILDFAKAFDKVPHLRLPDHYGVTGNLLNVNHLFIRSIITGSSRWYIIILTSGVPQGSVCTWPNTFLVYLNDIASVVESKLCLFADDCIIYRTISSSNNHPYNQYDIQHLEMVQRQVDCFVLSSLGLTVIMTVLLKCYST